MTNHKQRLTLEMTALDAIMALTEGNIGAVTVCTKLLKDGGKIDPLAFDPLVNLMDLDALGIYGSRIWLLYKDVCGQKIGNVVGLLRGWQLGKVSEEKLLEAVGTDETRGKNGAIDVDDIVAKVRLELGPDFNPEAVS
jgi:hypothetical protein